MEALVDHIGGAKDELGVPYPPDMGAFLRAYRAVADRLQPGSRAVPTSRATAYRAIAGAHLTTTEAIRKAVDAQPQRERRPSGDHRELIMSPGRPGTPRIFIDIKELNRRYPGAWERLTAGLGKPAD